MLYHASYIGVIIYILYYGIMCQLQSKLSSGNRYLSERSVFLGHLCSIC